MYSMSIKVDPVQQGDLPHVHVKGLGFEVLTLSPKL